MEYFDGLLVIPLEGCPGKEHVGYLPEGKGGVRIEEFNTCWGDVHVPLSKIRVSQHQQVDDV